MSLPLLRKSARDTWFILTAAALAIAIFEVLAILAFHYAVRDARLYFDGMPPFVRRFVNVLAGMDIQGTLTPTGLMSIGFAHPIVHIVLWSFTIAFTTRVLVGEIDRGTADLLLSLPLSRARVYATLSTLWLLAGVVLAAAPCAGTWFAQWYFGRGPFDFPRLGMVSVNLFALYLAIGAASLMVSSMLSRRGPAIGLIFAVLEASFILNFLAAIWEPAKQIAFLGVLDYYRPLPIIVTGQWPVKNLVTLLAAAVVCWSAGLVVYARRDIRTG